MLGLYVYVVFAVSSYTTVQSANILFVATMASPSHHVWNKELILGLVGKGHNVTSLTHLTETEQVKNWTLITIEGLYKVLPKLYDMKKLTECTILEAIAFLYVYPRIVCEYDLNSEELQTLLNYPSDAFDLIIFDTTLGQCMYPLIEKFNNPPVVALYLLPLLMSRSFGTPIYTSHMPYYSTSFSDDMTFGERILNFIYMHVDYFYYYYVSLPVEHRLAQKRFGTNIRSFAEVENNINLVLTNTDPNFDYAISLPPNIIPVGGLHLKPAKQLPENLKSILDTAKDGVILVSFGTNVDPAFFSLDSQTAFLNAFGRLNQTILWKSKSINQLKFPKNVMAVRWLPQQDVLGHPNLKLFISQCGGFSYQEAIYHGVPIVAIPFVIDQYTIATRLSKRKLAVKLNHWELTADKIYSATIEVLYNPIYRNNIKMVSEKYRHQPQTPLERGLFWIEYVLKHGDTKHLVPAATKMPSYQLANFDIVLFFVVLIYFAYSLVV